MNSKTQQSADANNETTILLIDDNQVNNNLVASILKPQGYHIYTADNGNSGIKMVRELNPDLVMLDIMMPKIDGFQVCSHLQKDPLTSEIPIIFITEDATVKNQAKAFQLGGSDFITKPIVDVVLIERVKNQIRLSRDKKRLKTLNTYYELSEQISNTGFWACRRSSEIDDFTCSGQFTQMLNFSNCAVRLPPPTNAANITALLRSSKDQTTRTDFADEFEDCLIKGGFFDEVCNFRFRKTNRYIRIWARFTLEREELIIGFGAVQDITQIINTENELAKIKSKFDDFAHKQNIVAANTQLAHEINQPLAAISLNTNYIQQLLETTPRNIVNINEALSDIVKDINRATNIVKNFRRFIKKEPVISRNFDLRELLDDTLHIFSREIQQKNIELIFNRPDQPCVVFFDRTGLQQVVINLIKNAIEAISKRDTNNPLIEVSVDSDEKEAVIFVSDNGPGISTDNQEKIFQQYFTSKKGNTGMGLVICKALMSELDGDICLIEPLAGHSTSFKVVIPHAPTSTS